ncbi:unnamed protein product [Nezara viridula]|uniref:Uncharacterized protein n=1 Tax=Nezara viridula TaxID=85310 RepID=A0A9P0EFN3_NEZVI|nr:unnamed protein product [Nezara viridula]
MEEATSYNKINLNAKLKVFKAAVKSIIDYGAQVWGGCGYKEVEKVQYYFIKRYKFTHIYICIYYSYRN